MKKILNIFLVAAMALGIGSCSSESPFESGKNGDGQGRVLTNGLTVEVKTDEALVRSASTTPDVSAFAIEFYDTTDGSVAADYTYGAMPEVVTLPVGTYKVRAYFGGIYGSNGESAAYNAPYYFGESEDFSVEKDKIVDNIKPIVCKLANVKVTITFDANLVAKMSSDSKVSVSVGDSGSLDFKPSTDEAGYFAYVEGSNTLVASFIGTVEGDPTTENKTYSNVAPGKHYKITFKLHTVDPNEPGHVNPGETGEEIKVDATVDLSDFTGDGGVNIELGDEITLVDDRYPVEDPDDPNNPDNPDDPNQGDEPTPPTPGAGPTISTIGATLGTPNYVAQMTECKLIVNSETGIETFTVTIDSDTLTPDELESVGLVSELDLVNPGALVGSLQNLGFLDQESNQQTLKGETDVELDISKFLGLLSMLGAGNHKFILSVGDSTGVTKDTLILITE